MRNKLNPKRLTFALAFALVALLSAVSIVPAETSKKLHTSPQLIINGNINDATDTTAGVGLSSNVDLSGGDLDVADFQLHITSGACSTCTFDIAIQSSADGGTTWANAGTFTQITSSNSASDVYKTGVVVAPGTKMRLATTLSASTTFYVVKVWAMPRAGR